MCQDPSHLHAREVPMIVLRRVLTIITVVGLVLTFEMHTRPTRLPVVESEGTAPVDTSRRG